MCEYTKENQKSLNILLSASLRHIYHMNGAIQTKEGTCYGW